MSYFDRLDKILNDLESNEKQQYDNLLKIQDLTHKAKIAEDYNKIQEEYMKTQNSLLKELREVEKEKDIVVRMRKTVDDKTLRLKSMIMDFKHSQTSFRNYLGHLKKDMVSQYKRIEGGIYGHSDKLVNFVYDFINADKDGNKVKDNAREYFIRNCSNIVDVKVKKEAEFDNKQKQIQAKESEIKAYIANTKKIIK